MNKIKNFLNKAKHLNVKDLAPKIAINHAIEKQLIPRLKVMGFILFAFSVCSCFYAYFSANYSSPYDTDGFTSPEEMKMASGLSFGDDPESPPFELTAAEKFNFYFVAFVFASVGVGCILLSIKKKKEHLQREHINKINK